MIKFAVKKSVMMKNILFTKVSEQILHNNYSHNLESNSIVLFGANDYTIGLALSLEPRSTIPFTSAFTSRIVILDLPGSVILLHLFLHLECKPKK